QPDRGHQEYQERESSIAEPAQPAGGHESIQPAVTDRTMIRVTVLAAETRVRYMIGPGSSSRHRSRDMSAEIN
ncbi:MAG TPA: hypothetical protein VLD58_13220, partial [Gemmatimonadales bacterium]|nr:hypothetical protein [Gemmatimonadales bacterium]